MAALALSPFHVPVEEDAVIQPGNIRKDEPGKLCFRYPARAVRERRRVLPADNDAPDIGINLVDKPGPHKAGRSACLRPPP